MQRRRVLRAVLLLCAVYAAVGGCAPASPPAAVSPVTPVAIPDLTSVAGKWEGLGQGPWAGSVLGGHDADWIEFTIKGDGTYEVRAYREIGVLRSAGTLTLSDNVIRWKSDRASGVLALVYDRGGKRVLRLHGQLATGGGALSAELTPAR